MHFHTESLNHRRQHSITLLLFYWLLTTGYFFSRCPPRRRLFSCVLKGAGFGFGFAACALTPVERPLAPHVNVTDKEQGDEQHHLDVGKRAQPFGDERL